MTMKINLDYLKDPKSLHAPIIEIILFSNNTKKLTNLLVVLSKFNFNISTYVEKT